MKRGKEMSRHKSKKTQQPLSPKKYIVTKARSLPVYKCLVNKDWKSAGLANILVMRKHTNGNVTAGAYLVDIFARGVKDTAYFFNQPEDEILSGVLDSELLTEMDYTLVHNIIYGAVEFAEEHNFKTHGDFSITEFILEEDTDDIELMEIEFGVNGKPFLVDSDYDEWDDDDDEFPGEEEDELLDDADVPDFDQYTDKDWRAYFSGFPSFIRHLPQRTNALLNNLIQEKYPEDFKNGKYFIEEFEVGDEFWDGYPFTNEAERKRANKVFDQFHEADGPQEISKIEEGLRELQRLNPANPRYLNYLAQCAIKRNDYDSFRKLNDELVSRFPDYFYGIMPKVDELINEGKIEEVEALLKGRFWLEDYFPGRKIFNEKEWTSLAAIMVRYFIKKDKLREARKYFEILNLFDVNMPLHELANQEFFIYSVGAVNIYVKGKYGFTFD